MLHSDSERFRFLGGHLALDFVNTVGGRTHLSANRYVVERDRLDATDDLCEWAHLAALVSAGERRKLVDAARAHPRASAAVLERARRLREALYRVFRATIEGRKLEASELEVLNSELAVSRSHERLGMNGGRLGVIWDRHDALDRPLWDVARSAAVLLTGDELSRVRQCGGESCGWLFLDVSRNRSRQWCDMSDCGNIAKVRRFRERQKEGQ